MVLQLKLPHPELEHWRVDKLGKLLLVDTAVTGGIHALKQLLHLASVERHVALLLLERQFFVRARRLHCLLHEHGIYNIENGKPKDTSVEQEEDGKPLTDVLHQNSGRWTPVSEEYLKHGKERAGECAIEAEDFLPKIAVLALVADELSTEGAGHHSSHALHEGEEAKAPKEHVCAGADAFDEQLKGCEHAVHGHHTDGTRKLPDPEESEQDGVHRKSVPVVHSNLED
mmetsp:Transcript_51151/g.119893  ORF Transcript_51151/g.119893 Transcript_51151/m.119893 type:complete len:228 (+) Transcript_51151:420-1103(+)